MAIGLILPALVIQLGSVLPPAEAAVVAELFSSYLQEGKSLKAETQRLTSLGVASPAGKARWNQASIRGILTNPVYTGTVYIGRSRPTEARGRHCALVPLGRERGGHVQTSQQEWTAVTQVPAVITQEQFDLIQTKLSHNQQFARRNNTAYPYLLRAMESPWDMSARLHWPQQSRQLCILRLCGQEPWHYLASG